MKITLSDITIDLIHESSISNAWSLYCTACVCKGGARVTEADGYLAGPMIETQYGVGPIQLVLLVVCLWNQILKPSMIQGTPEDSWFSI